MDQVNTINGVQKAFQRLAHQQGQWIRKSAVFFSDVTHAIGVCIMVYARRVLCNAKKVMSCTQNATKRTVPFIWTVYLLHKKVDKHLFTLIPLETIQWPIE